MPAAYWIANVHVTNPEPYAEYARLAGQAIAEHGGEVLARGGRHVQIEGRDRARNVIVRFASMEKALEFYNSPTYQKALTFAKGNAERDIVIVEGM
jgi:uncharacterized protein (DUF1330 family)